MIKRLIIYSTLIAILSLLLVGYLYQKEKGAWNEVADQIVAVHSLSESKTRKQSLNNTIRKKYSEVDSFYLDNQVATLHFLKKEREALEALIQTPSFTGSEVAERRYTFLLGEGNHLQFTEGGAQSGEGVQETTEILAHPVELDTRDLKELLNRIEGNRPGKPQLIVTDFKLNRKTHASGNQVFELNLKLLKREFTQ